MIAYIGEIVNLLNTDSYYGIQYNYFNGGAAPTINGVYGSPVKLGVEIDAIADIGRIENLHFSPEYWIGSNLNATALTQANKNCIRDYIYDNGVGLSMRRNDWSFSCYLDIEGYNIGFRAAQTLSTGDSAVPNGHNYGFKFTGCKTGIQLDRSDHVGIMFSDIVIDDCEKGIVIPNTNSGFIQFSNADIKAKRNAIEQHSGTLMLNSSIIREGYVLINGGTFNALGNIFQNKTPQITYGYTSRGILTDNEFTNTYTISDSSINKHTVVNTPGNDYAYAKIKPPVFPNETAAPLPKGPARNAVYVVDTTTNIPVLFPGNDNSLSYTTTTSTPDATSRIQAKLDEAATAGGGIVFLPPGKYRVAGSLTIPSGVELRGAGGEIATVPHGVGSILEIYGGKNNPGGDPAIIMESGSGMRGVVINYPEQLISNISAGKLTTFAYPYTIQGRGDNIYVINVGLRAVLNGMDFDTYRCDNLYVDFVTGHVFDQALKYGNNAEGAIIKNVMANVIVYGCGDESKYGTWANGDRSKVSGGGNQHTYTYSYENLDFMEIGDCKNTYMFNNFHYGSKIGIHYINQGNGGPQNINNMGLGIDGARQSVMFDSGLTGTYNFINSQTVSTNGGTYNDATYMIGKANSSFTANIYGSDYWGQPYTAFNLEANSGIINLYCANVAEAGSAFINLAGGQLNFLNSNMRGNTTDRRSSNGSAPYIKQISSLMNYTNSGTKIGPTSYGPEEGGAKYTFQDKTAWTGVRTWASQTFSGNKDDVLIENDDAWSGGWQDTTVRSGQLTSTFPLVLQIDMGAAKTFDVIQIEWGGGGGSDYPRANFQIWQSNTAAPTGWGTTANTTNFAQIASITSAAAGTSTYEIASITARYLMLRISANPNQGAHWAVKNVRIGTKNPSPILSRTGWTAQAKGSADSTNAGMAINGVLGNSNNEWKMGWQNASGTALPQWWMVDTGSAAKNYNTVLLVHGGGGNDWPEGGQICTGTAAACWSTTTTAGVTGTNWTVRGPNNIGSSTKIDIGAQTARYVMIRRPVGSADRGAYWAIQDFQLANFVDIAQPTANQNALRQASYLGYRIVIEPDSSWTRASGTGNTINFRVIIDPDFTGTPVVSYRAAGGATVGTTITPTAGVYSTNNLTADRIIEVTGITKKTEQTIAFPDNNAPRNILTNDTSGPYPVTTTGAGSGAITYSSANPLIATVNATTGEVTPLNIGTTTITARKAEDATYASATASYVLTVSSPESAAAQTPPIVYARGFEPGIEVRDAASTTVTGRVQKDPVEGKFAYFIQDHACPSSEGYEIDVRAAWGVDVSEANYLAFDIMATNTAILADINGFYPRICNGDSTWGKFTQYNGGSALSNINTLGANTWKTISIPIDASANIASTEQGGVDKTDVTAVRLRLTRSVKTKLPVTGNGTLFIRNVRFQAAPSTPAPNYTPTVPMGPTDSTFNSRGAGVAATAPDRYPSYKMNLNSSNTIVHINYTNENNLQDLSEYTNKFFVFEMYVTDASLLDLNPNGNNWFIMVGEKDKWNNSRARLNLNVAEIRKAKPKTWVTVSAQLTKNNTGGKTFSEGDEGGVPYTDAMFGFDEIRRMGLQLDWNGPTTGDIYIREPRFQDNPFSPGSEAPTASNPIITSNYTADPSAHVWLDHDGGERLWLYPSTDIFPARGCNMMDQYHVYSTDNMLDWIDHGEIIRRDDIPTTFGAHHSDAYFMWAPDAAYNANATGTKKGPFFYYFPHSTGMDGGGATGWGENWYIFVANSDSPYENFKTNGFTNSSTAFVRLTDSAGNLVKSGTNMDIIDPCVFADDDGTYYMITGGGGQCRIARLKPSMTQLDEPWTILNQRYNSGLTASYNKLPNYHEGPWLFYRYNDSGVKIYYLAYPGNPTGAPGGDDMLYCTASSPYGPWTPRGSILGQVNTGDTSHGSIQQFKGKWYIFYHNAVLSGGDGALRSVCVEEIVFNPDGTIQFAPQTDTSVPAVAPPVKKSDLDKEFGKDEYKIEKKFRDIKPPDPDD
ncbi:MAG: family 43 glycosylhydrolase, partial [Oscillospiraceae bacterium]|nr:family 43 glycosylhydrolase [Oscillospiraceae bacterium]